MRGTIKRLFGVCAVLLLLSLGSWYVASRQAAPAGEIKDVNVLAQQLGGEPGDGWRLAGGFLLLVAGAVAFAGGMLWWRERQEGGAEGVSNISGRV